MCQSCQSRWWCHDNLQLHSRRLSSESISGMCFVFRRTSSLMKHLLAIARPARMCMQCSELPSTFAFRFSRTALGCVCMAVVSARARCLPQTTTEARTKMHDGDFWRLGCSAAQNSEHARAAYVHCLLYACAAQCASEADAVSF